MRRALKIGVILAVLGFGGFLVAAFGIIPIKASSGHWAITRSLLQFTKERSVATHSFAIKSPPLDEPWLVLKGAGHYEIGCRPCHGSPELHHPRIAQRMLPAPPYLAQAISKWEREELFYIIKHGLKFTGMPAWPSPQRDDEVWAMVAFLVAFPELDAEKYRGLVNGESRAFAKDVPLTALEGSENLDHPITVSCARCHGADGLGREVAAFPKLAGQRPTYLAASLEAFASGKRHSGIMEPIAAALSAEQIRELARHYEKMESPSPLSAQHDTALAIVRGEAIAQLGIPNQNVPACAGCHDHGTTPRNPTYPVLEGQYAEYLTLQLTLFKQEQRGGTPYAHLMRRVAMGLNAEQMRDVASYYASQAPRPASQE
jgi:cytochrome c553